MAAYHGALLELKFRLSERTLWDIVRLRLVPALLLFLLLGITAAIMYFDPHVNGISARLYIIIGTWLSALSYLLSALLNGMLRGGRCTQPWLEDLLPELLSGSAFDTTREVFSTPSLHPNGQVVRVAIGEDWDAKTKRELLAEPRL